MSTAKRQSNKFPKTLVKELKVNTEHYLQFTKKELKEFGLKPGDKFDWIINDDGSVFLKPWVEVDIGDIKDYPREVLEMLVLNSIKNDTTINEEINNLLKQSLKQFSTPRKS